jgi:hypothetical protein
MLQQNLQQMLQLPDEQSDNDGKPDEMRSSSHHIGNPNHPHDEPPKKHDGAVPQAPQDDQHHT